MPDLTAAVPDPDDASFETFESSLTQFIDHPEFPCVGAKATFHQHQATVRLYDVLGSPEATAALSEDLARFVADTPPDLKFVSFLAMFRGPEISDEHHFEQLLWRQLTLLADHDTEPWSQDVSPDPHDDHFGLSAFGMAFFVVGLHPRASRDARRSGSPVLVFNPHGQFERLREDDQFERLRDLIRRRDARVQGDVNPMVDDFGSQSEARQYSGRRVEPDWEPPEWIGSAS